MCIDMMYVPTILWHDVDQADSGQADKPRYVLLQQVLARQLLAILGMVPLLPCRTKG